MRNQTPFLDYATKDYLGYRQLMIDQIPIKMPEYTERSESDAGISIIELLSYGLDVTSFNIDIIANEAFLYTAREIENVLKWTNSFGDPRRSSSSAVFQQVFEVQKSASPIYIPRGTKIRTATAMNELPIVFETTDDLEIPAGMVGNEQNPDGTYKYFVDVIEGVSVYDDVLGTSNAVQSQTFRLSYTPVIADSVRIFVNEGSGANEWRRVPNFLESTADSQVFSINIETNGIGILQFGNGNSGKIPTPFLNGISATYRTGGGTIGNVGAYKIVEMQSPIAGVIKTYNPSGPKIGGQRFRNCAGNKR